MVRACCAPSGDIPKITNERTEEFDRRAQVLRNQRDFGGTGEPINFGGRIVNPGDDDYMEYINTPFTDKQEKIQEILSRY